MKDITIDVLMAIIQSNLAAFIGDTLDPDKVRIICANTRESLEHHENKKEQTNG